MKGMNGRRIALAALCCACMAGCSYDTQCRVDSRVGSLGGCPMDTTPPPSPPAEQSGAGSSLDSIRATAAGTVDRSCFRPRTRMPCATGLATVQASGRLPARGLRSPRAGSAAAYRSAAGNPQCDPGQRSAAAAFAAGPPGGHAGRTTQRDRGPLCRLGSHPARARAGAHARPNAADARPVAIDRGEPQSAHSPGGLRRGSSPRQHDPGRRLSQPARRLSVG